MECPFPSKAPGTTAAASPSLQNAVVPIADSRFSIPIPCAFFLNDTVSSWQHGAPPSRADRRIPCLLGIPIL